MKQDRRSLLSEALQRVSQRMPTSRYQPEKHYMRGPGPKTLTKIGEMFRSESDDIACEPVPQRWLDLLHTMEGMKRRD